MKLLVRTIALLLFSYNLSLGNAQQVDSAVKKLAVEQPLPSGKSVPLVNFARHDTIITTLQAEMQALKRENELYRTTLDLNSNLFGGISTYFTVVTLLLTLLLAAIPLVSYFLVLRPNRRMQAKVESMEGEMVDKIEKNFESYFQNLRRAKTQQMLALLDDSSRVSEVTGYFLFNDSGELAEADVAKVIQFLKVSHELERSDLYVLNSLVRDSGLPMAEKYYKSIFEHDDTMNYEYAIGYLVTNNFPEHIKYIEKIISAATNGHGLLIDFFDYIAEKYLGGRGDKKSPEKQTIGIKYTNLLFNNTTIMEAIAGKPIPSRFNNPRINRNVLTLYPFIRETNYYAIYLLEMDNKRKSSETPL